MYGRSTAAPHFPDIILIVTVRSNRLSKNYFKKNKSRPICDLHALLLRSNDSRPITRAILTS